MAIIFFSGDRQKEYARGNGGAIMRPRITMDKAAPYQGAMDFSHLLDAPAGKYGHVQIKDGHFYLENGKRILR